MAFVDLGDQFVALAASRAPSDGGHRHVGIVVSDRESTLAAAREAGADVRGNDVRDPWGNVLQIVDYADVQFTKDPGVLAGMGLAGLGKRAEALAELRAKGLLS
jgi:lactoylglutathione lyase